MHVGKAIRLEVEADSAEAARARLDELCRNFLTNPVLEDAELTVVGGP